MAIDLPIIGQPNWGEPLNAALRELDSRVGVPWTKNRRAMWSFGGQREASALYSDTTVRLPFRLPVSTTRWRIRGANFNVRDNVAYSPVNVSGVAVGEHALGGSGTWDFGFTGSPPVQLPGFTLSADEHIGDWVTAPEKQIPGGREYLLSFGFTCAPEQLNTLTLARGAVVGGANLWNAVYPAGRTAISSTPLNFWIEYEFTGTQPVGLFIGDSNMDAYGSAVGWPATWPYIAANRSGSIACAIPLSGATAAMWAAGNDRKWSRWGLDALNIDYAVIGLGGNDLSSGADYVTTRGHIVSIVNRLKSVYGIERVAVATVTPHNGWDSVKNGFAESLNNYLRNGYGGINGGVIDMHAAVCSPSDPTQIRADFNGDGVHMNVKGFHRMGSEAAAMLSPLSAILPL